MRVERPRLDCRAAIWVHANSHTITAPYTILCIAASWLELQRFLDTRGDPRGWSVTLGDRGDRTQSARFGTPSGDVSVQFWPRTTAIDGADRNQDQTLPTVFSRARGWISAFDRT